jgi:H+/Cl- antiporter ClcA
MPPMFGLFVVLGALFGLLAGACAFVIAYAEYQRHFPGRRKPLQMALQTALVAFLFFFLLSAVLPWVLQFTRSPRGQ